MRMNWHDFNNNQFKYNGVIFNLYRRKRINEIKVRTRIIFLLNIYRGRWVKTNDLVEFVYGETPLDNWPDFQKDIILIVISQIRALLPKCINIISSRSFGYRLEIIKGNKHG